MKKIVSPFLICDETMCAGACERTSGRAEEERKERGDRLRRRERVRMRDNE